MDQDHNRLEEEYAAKIRQALRDKKLVIIVGAGISLSATHPSPPRITWTGLIRNGLEYLEKKRFVEVDDAELTLYRTLLQQSSINVRTVLRACGYLKGELDHNKQFPTWLESVFGSLDREVTHPEILKALCRFHQKGARLMTTNYDELLEHYCNLQRVRRSIPEDVRKYEQGTLNGVFHIHGSFQDPQEVVLDPTGYYQVKTSEDVQNLLKFYLGHNTILFVGCGSGLEDPNFNALLDWASGREENIPNHHYLLVREGDDLRYNPLITLTYGRSHENLVPYLNVLLEDPPDAFPTDPLLGKQALVEKASGDLDQLLPYAAQAPFNASGKDDDPSCLPNTRVEIQRQIRGWADENDKRHIFWLSGWAGTGKSTIARTVAREYYNREKLGASFFFSRGGGDTNHAGKFVTSIAFQLAQNVPSLRRYIYEAVLRHRDVIDQTLRDQWHQLVLDPLSKFNGNSRLSSHILVVDALDECDNEDHIQIILRLLAETRSLMTARLRVFMTSRPEIPIRHGFLDVPETEHEDFVLHNISPSIVDHDISIFLEYKLKIIGRNRSLGADWPGEDTIRCLVRNASGLFIWAATAYRFIHEGKGFAVRRLEKILEGSSSDVIVPEKHLDEIYITVLKHSVSTDYTDEEKKELCGMLRITLGSIVVLLSPLSCSSLSALLHLSKENVSQTLDDLHTILDISGDQTRPLRLHHPSFRDFLLNKTRCDPNFWVNEEQAHWTMADGCIRLMSTVLKQDICDQRRPGVLVTNVESVRVEECLRPEVQYACLYWVQHLQKSGAQTRDHDRIYQFLKVHLLHWLEALSWMRKISEGILAIISLETIFLNSDYPDLYAFVHDMKRFALYSRSVIEQAPLQIYCSALVFAPATSIVKNQFKDWVPDWMQRLPDVPRDWSALLQTLEGHTDSVSAVAFSRDGQLLASASYDTTVRLWDPKTGTTVQTLEGHTGLVSAVAFSRDGQLLASASYDTTVRLWDPKTGTAVQTLEGHTGSVSAVAFSRDGQLLASASYDTTVRLWDPKTGTAVQTLEGHTKPVNAVAFSRDGQLLASVSYDTTVRLWDPKTGTAVQTLEGHTKSVSAVAFSRDGQLLASASYDTTVRLWDPKTGTAVQTLEGHTGSVSAVAFSRDGQLLASASYDTTVRLWDPKTGTAVQTLEGHTGSVSAVAFSRDGQLLASASNDRTVRLWDPKTGTAVQTLEGHTSWVSAVAFSRDGQLLASASYDTTVRLWDPKTGTTVQTLEGHTGLVSAVAFSRDGQLLASASYDTTVRLWDPKTGTAVQTLEGHTGSVSAVAFSRDGQLLASASYDTTVRLWDPKTGTAVQTLEGHTKPVNAVAFSRDGQLLASVSYDTTVRLWDPKTGTAVQTLEGHTKSVSAVAFSRDGQLLASASYDTTVRLWDPKTGTAVQTLEGHTEPVNAVAFSRDGQLLASASYDTTVRLWDPKTGTAVQTLEGHTSWVSAVAFSRDGQLLASASYDTTVRLWDPKTGTAVQTLEGHTEPVSAVAFSRDGQLLASASYDTTVRLWDPKTGTAVQTLEGHTGSVSAVAFSRDGQLLASASDDRTVRLWDPKTGTAVQTLEIDVVVRALSFSADGSCLETDRGLLDATTSLHPPGAVFPQPALPRGMFVKEQWVAREKDNLLWLPSDYRPESVAIRRNIVVLGHASGRISFLEFALS